ncbi:MAG: hypothetical protein ABIS17_14395 [Casimicrobiaceae bacterium]
MGEQVVAERGSEMALDLLPLSVSTASMAKEKTAWTRRKNWAAAALAWLRVAQAQAKCEVEAGVGARLAANWTRESSAPHSTRRRFPRRRLPARRSLPCEARGDAAADAIIAARGLQQISDAGAIDKGRQDHGGHAGQGQPGQGQ